MFYIEWDELSIRNLSEVSGCVRLVTEVAQDGTVLRELGFNAAGVEVHRAPSKKDAYGLFDLAPIQTTGLESTIEVVHFHALWERSADSQC